MGRAKEPFISMKIKGEATETPKTNTVKRQAKLNVVTLQI